MENNRWNCLADLRREKTHTSINGKRRKRKHDGGWYDISASVIRNLCVFVRALWLHNTYMCMTANLHTCEWIDCIERWKGWQPRLLFLYIVVLMKKKKIIFSLIKSRNIFFFSLFYKFNWFLFRTFLSGIYKKWMIHFDAWLRCR